MLDFGFYNMDCMDGMREIPDKYFELAIVDPPYGITLTTLVGVMGDSRAIIKKARDSRPMIDILTSCKGLAKIKLYGEQIIFPCRRTKCFIVWRKPQIARVFRFLCLNTLGRVLMKHLRSG